LENRLNLIYTADILIDIHKKYIVQILDSSPGFFQEWGLDENEFGGVYIRKEQLARLLAIVLNDPILSNQLITYLPKNVTEIMAIIVWEGEQDPDYLQQSKQIEILDKKSQHKKNVIQTLRPDFCLFTLQSFENALNPGTFCYSIDLPKEIKPALKPQFPIPAGYHLAGRKTISSNLIIFEDKGEILRKLPLAQDFISQGQLKLTRKGRPDKSSLKRLQQFCELDEFYQKDDPLKLKTIRTELILHLLHQVKSEGNNTTPLAYLRNIFNIYQETNSFPHLDLMSHVKGWQYINTRLRKNVHISCLKLLGELPDDEWISTDQILHFCSLREIDLTLVSEADTLRYLYFTGYWKGWGSTRTAVSKNLIKDLIQIPLLKAVYFVYAAFGLIDIAYHLPHNRFIQQEQSPFLTVFDGLEYFRLTPLGAHISGKLSEYPISITNQQSTEILLDEKRLLIVLSRSDKSLELFLEQFSRRIGKTRFMVDFLSFFQSCNNIEDLTHRITQFKEKFHTSLPENWTCFFEQCQQRVDPLIPENEMVVFKLPAHNSDLISLISKSKEINKIILKAENHHIVVSKKNIPILKNWLKNQGYLF